MARSILAAALLALAGCTTFDGGAYSRQLLFDKPTTYDFPISCKSGTYTVQLDFVTAEEARKECGGRAMACYRSWPIPRIIIAHPQSWNDTTTFATFGHEVCHLAGGRHE
jgi:hypothetical protein